MKKFAAALSALSLFASSGAFAQETVDPATTETVPVVPAVTTEPCENLTGVNLELCQLRERRKAEKADAKAAHKRKVAKTAKKAALKATRVPLRQAMKAQRGAIQEMRKNFRGEVREEYQSRRNRNREWQQEQPVESGQALLVPYTRKSIDLNRHKSLNYKRIDVFQRGAPRNDYTVSARIRKARRDTRDEQARLRKQSLPLRQPEALEEENAQ